MEGSSGLARATGQYRTGLGMEDAESRAVVLKYLTITLAYEKCLPGILPHTAGTLVAMEQRIATAREIMGYRILHFSFGCRNYYWEMLYCWLNVRKFSSHGSSAVWPSYCPVDGLHNPGKPSLCPELMA